MVYIGDSATDIPCMRLVKSEGGYSIGVFDPTLQNTEKVAKLFADGRLSYYAPADYRDGAPLDLYVKRVIDEIASRVAIRVLESRLT
jgi:hypothetical protein